MRAEGDAPGPILPDLSVLRGRTIACIGDSITHGTALSPIEHRWFRGWVEVLSRHTADCTGEAWSGGYRGMWRKDEWATAGTWQRPPTTEMFDAAPFGIAAWSLGHELDGVRWAPPENLTVSHFDLIWFDLVGGGRWQYRVDDGAWLPGPKAGVGSPGLRRFPVDLPITAQVEVRAFDGTAPCPTLIAGIAVFDGPRAADSTAFHNLGFPGNWVGVFARRSSGDPMAVLDLLQPDFVTMMFSNDVIFESATRFGDQLAAVIDRVTPRAQVLVMAPFEQRGPRVVTDARTAAGSTALWSSSARFLPSDAWRSVEGQGVAPGTTIDAVLSAECVCLSNPATADTDASRFTIGQGRAEGQQAAHRAIAAEVAAEHGCAFLDLHEAWASVAGPGWLAADAAGLLIDTLHPSQAGHYDIAQRVAAWLVDAAR